MVEREYVKERETHLDIYKQCTKEPRTLPPVVYFKK